MDPSAIVTVANGTYTVINQYVKLRAAPDEVQHAVKQLSGFRRDLERAKTMRDAKFDFASPDLGEDGDYLWAQGVIKDFETDLAECQLCLEAVDGGGRTTDGRFPITDTFAWVYGKKDTYKERQPQVSSNHLRLMTLLLKLKTLPDVPKPQPRPIPYLDTDEVDLNFLSPDQIRRKRGRSVESVTEQNDKTGYNMQEVKPEVPPGPPGALKRRRTHQRNDDDEDIDQAVARRRNRCRSTP